MKKNVLLLKMGLLVLQLAVAKQPGFSQVIAFARQLPAKNVAAAAESRQLRDVLQT